MWLESLKRMAGKPHSSLERSPLGVLSVWFAFGSHVNQNVRVHTSEAQTAAAKVAASSGLRWV